ncbi:MAG: bifunctional 2-keto-4-hydroxyglutarate aldolase/2-keto-3-deoxy-6-phosphogluconate aldolase [Acidobacteriota bacterium]
MSKEKVLNTIFQTKVIAVIRMSDSEKLLKVIEAVQAGGVRAIEITMTTPDAIDVIKAMAKNKPQDVVIGAGSVLDSETARIAILSGAEFVVSPVTNYEMIKVCNRYTIPVFPGAFTPTEIVSAWQIGADIVKVFPATSIGPTYFKDIKGPLPHIKIMPTGGVNLDNAKDFIMNGACCVGIGTALLDKKAIETNDWNTLTENAKKLIASLANI